jgi:hypothetical protein
VKRKDISNQRFGKWSVQSEHRKDPVGRYSWKCICDCGRVEWVNGSNLRRGLSPQCVSCGNSLPDGEAAFNDLYADYKSGARRRGIPWDLTKEHFLKLTSSICHYTGVPPSNVWSGVRGKYVYNGIDRIDNSKGYTIENCVPCNGRINEMKMDVPVDVFIEDCRLVSDHTPEYATFALFG